jgi:hypothetical protein
VIGALLPRRVTGWVRFAGHTLVGHDVRRVSGGYFCWSSICIKGWDG